MLEAMFYIYMSAGCLLAFAYQVDFGDQVLVPLLLILFWPIVLPFIAYFKAPL